MSSPRPLLPDEVPEHLHSAFDFDSQCSERDRYGLHTYITAICPDCSGQRRCLVRNIRQAIGKGTFTGYCIHCVGRHIRQRWKGGRQRNQDGYILVWNPTHPNAQVGGYVLEHRLVMARMLSRPLKKNEQVHHINRIRHDNRPENLRLVSHHGEQICPRCGWLL